MTRPGVKKPMTFVGIWRRNPFVESYERVDFLPYPKTCPLTIHNMFNGLEGARLPDAVPVNVSWFEKHMSILTGHEDTGYMMDYCAHMVQRPGELSRVAILFKSNQGVGKNVFWKNFVNAILGREYLLQTADLDKIVGRFSMVQNKLCIIMDETSGKDSFLNSEKIKNSITVETIAWER